MNEQVLTIKQMKELQELGINISNASMIWEYKGQDNEYKDYYNLEIFDYTWEFVTDYDVPTFTLQDILEMLHKGSIYFNKTKFVIYLLNDDFTPIHEESGKTPLEAAFNMLKWVKQNNYI